MADNGENGDTENCVVDAWPGGGGGQAPREAKFAPMPVERYASHYNMKHNKRGIAIIFNHEHFEIMSLKSRTGTNVDCENLRHALETLNFDTQVYKDLRFNELQSKVETIARADHSDSDCLLIAILSHGELGFIYARDTHYKLDSIWNNFTANRCPTLAGKPKLFFIQACQGDRLDAGVTLTETDSGSDSLSLAYKIPIHADFLIAYSTIPGFYSWRNTTKGSWFMQCLCTELERHGRDYDILTLLTFVCQRVAIDFESNTPDNPIMHQQKQIPCVTTMLTRILRFGEQ